MRPLQIERALCQEEHLHGTSMACVRTWGGLNPPLGGKSMRAMDMPCILSPGKLATGQGDNGRLVAIVGLGASSIIRMIGNLIALNHLCEIIQRNQE